MSTIATIAPVQRCLEVEREGKTVEWRVTEFSNGNRMLVTSSSGVSSAAHFTDDEWAAFQALIDGTLTSGLIAGATPA